MGENAIVNQKYVLVFFDLFNLNSDIDMSNKMDQFGFNSCMYSFVITNLKQYLSNLKYSNLILGGYSV